jgi:hypothetical protein
MDPTLLTMRSRKFVKGRRDRFPPAFWSSYKTDEPIRAHSEAASPTGSRECAPDAGSGAVLRDLTSVAFSTKAGKFSL